METFLSFVYLIYFFVGLPLGVLACTCIKSGEWKKTFSKENLKREAKIYLILVFLGIVLMVGVSMLKKWLQSKS